MEKRDDGSGIRCNEHPDAPHGFMRDASHNEGRYVCECEFWEPPKNKPMTRDEWTAWLEESWAEAQARASTPEQKPVAHITGFHNGHCVIQPTDPAVVLPVGMALYRAPTEWVGQGGLLVHLAVEELERFAALVAAEKEKQIIDILERLQQRNDSHNYYAYAINVIKGEI